MDAKGTKKIQMEEIASSAKHTTNFAIGREDPARGYLMGKMER